MINPRKIIHIDMDCFYAAVEIRDHPELLNKPIAVGGDPGKRGVISTCNYLARQFGVRSAMATALAQRLCPQLIVQPGRMATYRQESAYIRDIFADYTDRIEPLSLDEAFLDVTGTELYQGSATWIAEEIRHRIFEDRQLTASAGIAPNKSLAKIASDWNKPNGQYVITPNAITGFMLKLPVRKLFGVGPVTEKRLAQWGITTCGHLQCLSKNALCDQFGSMGERLYELCRGIDPRPVNNHRIRKSISVEETYAQDLANSAACLKAIPELLTRLEERIARHGAINIQALFVKIKFNNFRQTTVETLATCIDSQRIHQLIDEGWQRQCLPVRLLGVGVKLRQDDAQTMTQLPLPF